MTRCIAPAVLVLLLATPAAFAQPPQDDPLWQRALRLGDSLLVIDIHAHEPFKPDHPTFPRQVSPELMRQGGVDGVVQCLPLDAKEVEHPAEAILQGLREMHGRLAGGDSLFAVARRADEVEKIAAAGKLPVVLGLEYFHGPLEGDAETLARYQAEGVRMLGFFSGGRDSVLVDRERLTPFGRAVVAEANELGIAIDITHLREPARQEVIRASRAPVVASHANAQGLVPSGFNLGDETLDSLAARGGVIGLTFFSESVSPECFARREETRDITAKPRASVAELIDHIDYVKARVGIDAVAIGSDYGGSGRLAPEGLETAAGFPLIIFHMLKRGYTDEEIAKVMGGNFLRCLTHVEAAAGRRTGDAGRD